MDGRKMLDKFSWFCFLTGVALALSGCGGGGSDSGGSQGVPVGRGGSMARFAVVEDLLYTISGADLQIFRLDQPGMPSKWAKTRVAFDIETLFGFGDHLLIGSQGGMYIYDTSDPEHPEFVSKLLHATSCDPVVAQGNYAYVTLRSGNRCQAGNNQLDVIDISDPAVPVLVKTYPMQGPKGLGVDGDKLFVCDDDAGLKVFDVADPLRLQTLQHLSGINCYDVIPNQGNLIVMGEDGLFQYDYRQDPMTRTSKIPFWW